MTANPDPIDLITGLTSDTDTGDVSKSDDRAEMKAALRFFADADTVRNTDLSARSFIFVGAALYVKDTGSTAADDGATVIIDGAGTHWLAVAAVATNWPGLLLTWDTGTSDADPGGGKLRANDASLASATVLYISKANRIGSSIATLLASLDDSTNTAKGIIVLTRAADGAQATFIGGAVTDATGYVKLAVSSPGGATAFTAGDAISLQFTRAGDKGMGDVVAANNGSDFASPTSVPDNIKAIAWGLHEIGHWPARALKPATSSGAAALATNESSSNKVNDEYLGFVNASTTYAGFSFRAPKSLDTSANFTAEIEWTEKTGATAHDCKWQVEMQAQGDTDTIDSAWGTAVTVVDTGSSGTRRFITTGTVTPGGSWASGDKIHVRIARLGADAADTLDVDAQLIGVTLFASVNLKNDA